MAWILPSKTLKSNQHSCLRKKHGLTALIYSLSCFQAEAAQSPLLNHAKMGMEDPSNSWNPSMHCQKEIQELTCSTLLTPKKKHGYTVQVQPLPDGGQIDQNLTELLHRFASLCLAHYLPKILALVNILKLVHRLLILNCLDLVSKKVGQLLSYFNSFFLPTRIARIAEVGKHLDGNHWLNITVISSRLLSFKPTKGAESQAPTPT